MSANGAECLRAVLSCARCRRRKIKCDRLAPACGRCIEAGVDCTGFNPKGNTEIPRSVVYFLEHEIANLEKDIGQNNLNVTDSEDIAEHVGGSAENVSSKGFGTETPISHTPTQGDVMKEAIMASNGLQSMIGATMPSGSCLTDMLSSVRMGLTPSYTPSSPPTLDTTPVQSSVSTRQHEEEVDIQILISLPTHVIHSLVKKFVQRVLPLYPFLHEPAIYKHVSRAIGKIPKHHSGMTKSSVRPDYDFLILYLILAISSTLGSANSGHEARCIAFSGSLFSEGIHHLSSKAPFPNDLAEIQSTLLILQYALINPKYANVWILSGVVMRSCLELGLHREVSPSVGLDSLTIDLRRQVFWVAYCMDRSICSALQRPLSIPDPTINTLFPALSLSEAGVTAPRPHPTKLLALRQIQFAKLQSTIIEVHFQGKPLEDGQTWDEWLAVTDQGLRNWYEVLPPEEDQTWAEVGFSQCLTNLYRPSPRVPFPSQRSLLVAFEAACGSAQIYQKHIATGFFRRPWLAAHNTFSSAMVALFCLRYGYEGICNRWNAGEIFQMTKLFTMNLLTLSAQGWSEISKYAGTYERLLGPLLDSVFTQSTSPSKSFGPEQDAELARLIYPGPAHLEKLRFGNAKASLSDDYQGFDAALFNWEDDFQGNILNWGEEQGFANSCSVPISRQAQTGSISPSVSPISYRQNWLQY